MAVRRVKVHMQCLTVFGSRRGLVKAQNNCLQGVLTMLFNGSNGNNGCFEKVCWGNYDAEIKLDIFIAWVVIRHPNLLMKPTSLR